MKHTPGPWKADIGTTFVAVHTKGNKKTVHINTNPEKGRDEAEANVHLIAAAPEMLEALGDARDALGHAIYSLKDDPSFVTSIAVKYAEEKVRAAIKKARGEQ